MTGRLAHKIDRIQTLFVALLRLWTIPIVLLLSVASGFTTYYGLSHFITPWIALIITVAIQSIIVIASLELASVRWRANRLRFLSVFITLLIGLAASISFSYFKFYEIAHRQRIQHERLDEVRRRIVTYLSRVEAAGAQLLKSRQARVAEAEAAYRQAYFGIHPVIPPKYRGLVGDGPFSRQFRKVAERERVRLEALRQALERLRQVIARLRTDLDRLGNGRAIERRRYENVLEDVHRVQRGYSAVAAEFGGAAVSEPHLASYVTVTEPLQPSFAMWRGFSPFAFACALMVDLFTVLLSYRLELSSPAPLSEDEKRLALRLLTQFRDYRINRYDELELSIERTPWEEARGYDDAPRLFAVGLLLKRGLLRRVGPRRVEFAPGLYSLIVEELSARLEARAGQGGDSRPERGSKDG